jgi:hypothetical protein
MGASIGSIAGGVISALTPVVANAVGATRTERTAKSITWSANVDQTVELASLRTAVAAGNTIFANDLNRIGTLINNMNGHYHTYDDAYQLATFGNTGDRTNYIENKNTNNIDDVASAPTNNQADTLITASAYNELVTAINELRVHFHGINDRTS